MRKDATKAAELLHLIREHGPVSPNRLAEISGDVRQSVDRYIRELRDAEKIHVGAYGPSPVVVGRTVKLWVFGAGEDAKRPRAQKKKYVRARKGTSKSIQAGKARADRARRIIEEANRLPARDPITIAWFGPSTRYYATPLFSHIYRQSMSVTDDELETA